MSILIYSIEDDEDIALVINKTLSKQGFDVKTYYYGKTFFNDFANVKPNIILLDLMLPDMSGLDILNKIRSDKTNEDIRVIIISAKNLTTEKVLALDSGADDYIEKPFDLLELMSRVEAHARRIRKKDIIEIGNIVIDVNKRECLVLGKVIDLTNKEFDILYLLLSKYPNVVTREDLFNKIWNANQVFESRTLDMHIKALRTKLGSEGAKIKSIYGIGYRYND